MAKHSFRRFTIKDCATLENFTFVPRISNRLQWILRTHTLQHELTNSKWFPFPRKELVELHERIGVARLINDPTACPELYQNEFHLSADELEVRIVQDYATIDRVLSTTPDGDLLAGWFTT